MTDLNTVRAAADRHRAAEAERNAASTELTNAVREARAEGHSVRRISIAADVSTEAIYLRLGKRARKDQTP